MNNTTPRLMIILLTLLQAHCLRSAEAREVFNTHALEIDNPGQPVADLSAFAESDGQLPGTYRVTVYVNSEKQGEAQDIAFVAGPDKKLTAQITPAMLKAWGVKTEVFPRWRRCRRINRWTTLAAISRWPPPTCASANSSLTSVFRRRR